jgi:hypothetical protein
LVGSYKAALRRYYKDPHILGKAGFAYGIAFFLIAVLLGPVMPNAVTAIHLVSMVVLVPYFLLIFWAMRWDRNKNHSNTARRCAERLKAWSQEP